MLQDNWPRDVRVVPRWGALLVHGLRGGALLAHWLKTALRGRARGARRGGGYGGSWSRSWFPEGEGRRAGARAAWTLHPDPTCDTVRARNQPPRRPPVPLMLAPFSDSYPRPPARPALSWAGVPQQVEGRVGQPGLREGGEERKSWAAVLRPEPGFSCEEVVRPQDGKSETVRPESADLAQPPGTVVPLFPLPGERQHWAKPPERVVSSVLHGPRPLARAGVVVITDEEPEDDREQGACSPGVAPSGLGGKAGYVPGPHPHPQCWACLPKPLPVYGATRWIIQAAATHWRGLPSQAFWGSSVGGLRAGRADGRHPERPCLFLGSWVPTAPAPNPGHSMLAPFPAPVGWCLPWATSLSLVAPPATQGCPPSLSHCCSCRLPLPVDSSWVRDSISQTKLLSTHAHGPPAPQNSAVLWGLDMDSSPVPILHASGRQAPALQPPCPPSPGHGDQRGPFKRQCCFPQKTQKGLPVFYHRELNRPQALSV
ncbi:hypothetical protein P7K49_012138 [Saguinus oedipus]|uniref:Uncharacterized protein n=1 Tax=Saguinus oedipus TaxID=9490 RepID=A0ABQ9VSL7_SAGOE|nr:hypothetical protein P7K49_012138 [Saguinus oedipus]